MARFFFDIHDGVEVRDEIGRELEPGPILRTEALKVVARLMEAEAEDAKETTLLLTVRDSYGSIHLKIRLVCQVEEH
ncbi:hypothetical protein HCU64_14715 [Methylobacterium sp. C25]|uniref:DUF6894 family protein n=1 Tax=Methylobacterium sp. C25 TaxID=2721622 RepID=UPI001F3EB8ED|nr:hypothetical protein [Methylobacterium sp. C25]MCE4225010.1 hypothetical protein [Methylobacterium sp. C25]